MNDTVTAQWGSSPNSIQITALPTIAQVESGALTTQLATLTSGLAGKQATMSFQGGSATPLPSSLLTFDNATLAVGASTGQLVIHGTPALADISDITTVAQNVSFGRPITCVLANDPGAGTEAPAQYFRTGTIAHQLSARFDTASDTNNYLRWYIRKRDPAECDADPGR